jgi:hypothetical protein
MSKCPDCETTETKRFEIIDPSELEQETYCLTCETGEDVSERRAR